MSGHSHWQTIRRKKESNDAKRGAVFTKVAREIVIAVREGGGGDPDTNLRLRMALDKARTMGMPKDNIERSIRRGTGDDKDAEEIIQVLYEGKWRPMGLAIMIDVLTDNRNRSVGGCAPCLSRAGGTCLILALWHGSSSGAGRLRPPAASIFEELFMVAVEAAPSMLSMGARKTTTKSSRRRPTCTLSATNSRRWAFLLRALS